MGFEEEEEVVGYLVMVGEFVGDGGQDLVLHLPRQDNSQLGLPCLRASEFAPLAAEASFKFSTERSYQGIRQLKKKFFLYFLSKGFD